MKFLLDTCIFLWFISGDRRLSAPLRELICDPTNEVFLSTVSIWESIVKHQLGKLPLPMPPAEYLPGQRKRHGISSLPLDEGSVVHLPNLPAFHRDPFDRMLICQAIQHRLTLVTTDRIICSYPVKTMPLD
jgi:PIN domain nuclease of toxin-antitoxin system